jgi:hypothetical protein
METLLQIPGEITKVETMGNQSLRLRFDSQESLTPEQRSRIMEMADRTGWMTFSPDPCRRIEPEDVMGLPEAPKAEKGDKTPSQRLRAVLYVLWEQTKPKETFEIFYSSQVERIITRIKDLLEKV